MDFSLIETMRWEPDKGFVRLNLHLARLNASAQALGFEGSDLAEAAFASYAKNELGSRVISPLEAEMSRNDRGGCVVEASIHPPLSQLATSRPHGGRSSETQSAHRVRLELFPDGKINITSAPFELQSEDTSWSVKIATTRLSSADHLLQHKTSRRAVYDQARAEFSKDQADEVLMLNEKGELCEGTITSLFVNDGTGILLTPPLSSGLLAGVLRTSLLCSKKARVQKLMQSDLEGKALYVGNSLRGLIRAKMN